MTVTRGFQRDDAAWDARLEGLVAFVGTFGRMPRHGPSIDPAENSLSQWLGYQRREHSCGALSPDRIQRLDLAMPAWRGRRKI
ncbi:helicase associated domain-containing protein [Nakamurella alba]|uniref:helicase associated domain-containing protein n=1 Tax=Nakamurella alba TaxID=2665158 RepID=UPI0012B9FF80